MIRPAYLTAEAMKVSINSKEIEIKPNTCLEELMLQCNFPDNGIAVAVNEEIISKSLWTSKTLNENDRLTVITATQGG